MQAVDNTMMTVPLIETLNGTGAFLVCRALGVPMSWSPTQLSMWLGREYDRVTFLAITNNNNEPYNIGTCYNNVHHNENEYIEVEMPISGFHLDFNAYLHRELVNVNIRDVAQRVPYHNGGGDDRFVIRVRRYNAAE